MEKINGINVIKEINFCGTGGIFKTKEAKEYFFEAMKKGKNIVGIIHRELIDSKGNKLWEFVGHNDTLIGGTQNFVLNIYDNMDKTNVTNINNIESEPGINTTTVSKYLSDKRMIFGIAVAHDGATLLQEEVVKRHTKGYTNGKLMAYQSIAASLDNPEENYKKYALRSTSSNGEIQYFVKLITPKIDNISLDSEANLPHNPDNAYHGNSDVMTRVTINFSITPEELVAWWGATYGTTEGGYMNSIMLVAGRPCEVIENGKTLQTYRDLICTNKSNFENKPIKNTKLERYSYELYYV